MIISTNLFTIEASLLKEKQITANNTISSNIDTASTNEVLSANCSYISKRYSSFVV
ncbi:MAG: hypothetical protein LHW51_10970 [Candidatus Cloacimonetes bacterium]|nr:hypothetical protein [Candidatus Cloacimonadota bacterium]